jgi:hypothetical protein
MPDFNATELSAAPINVALNALIDASVFPENTRGYLGASAVGHPCMRRIQFDWMCDPQHPARIRDIFDRGHYFEARTREHLVHAGFKFAPDERLRFKALGGMLSGHADGILIDGPKIIRDIAFPALWECKALNDKGWRSLDRDGLDKAYPQYAAQVSLYQHFLGVGDHPAIFTSINANSCERVHLLIPFNIDRANYWIERAQTIIKATAAGELLPRFTDNPNNWKCRLCGHTERCWRK